MELGSKLGKEHVKAIHCHPAYLTYMQSTSGEVLRWMNHKLETRQGSLECCRPWGCESWT